MKFDGYDLDADVYDELFLPDGTPRPHGTDLHETLVEASGEDLNAIGAIRAFRNRNYHVPADISVVGFDDLPSIAYATPALTTVRQDTATAGDVLVETLLDLVRGNDVVSRLLPPELIVRQSSRRLRAEDAATSRSRPRLTDARTA